MKIFFSTLILLLIKTLAADIASSSEIQFNQLYKFKCDENSSFYNLTTRITSSDMKTIISVYISKEGQYQLNFTPLREKSSNKGVEITLPYEIEREGFLNLYFECKADATVHFSLLMIQKTSEDFIPSSINETPLSKSNSQDEINQLFKNIKIFGFYDQMRISMFLLAYVTSIVIVYIFMRKCVFKNQEISVQENEILDNDDEENKFTVEMSNSNCKKLVEDLEKLQKDIFCQEKFENSLNINDECTVCLTFKANIKFLPCGHTCACIICAKALIEIKTQCPLCRSNIETVESPFEKNLDPESQS